MAYSRTDEMERPVEGRLQVNVADWERWACVTGGLVFVAAAIRQAFRGRSSASAAGLGVALLGRGLAGHCPVYGALGLSTAAAHRANTSAEGVDVRESIIIGRPVEEVYAAWRDLERLPRFMRHLERVDVIDDSRSHWVVKGPAGSTLEWDAEIVNDIPNRLLAWESLPGADIVSSGSVGFHSVDEGRSTAVSVGLQYEPPAGRVGALTAWLLGQEPSLQVPDDLERLKRALEEEASLGLGTPAAEPARQV